MYARLLDQSGRHDHVTWDDVREAHGSARVFWLDVVDYEDADLTEMGRIFSFHPLAIDDTRHFHQRSKLDPYDTFVLVVAFGSGGPDRLCEVHAYVTSRAVVTVRHGAACPPLDEVFAAPIIERDASTGPRRLLYRILHRLYASLEPTIEDIDERLTEIEEAVFARPDPAYLREITAIKRRVSRLRQAVVPHRDAFASGNLYLEEIPGSTEEAEHYFRDLYDLLVHVGELIESEREHATNVMDVYLSLVNNRQNETMKQLTVVATVFLPLSFLTGFFGMNFGYLIRHIAGPGPFFVLGLGLNLVAALGILEVLRRRRLT